MKMTTNVQRLKIARAVQEMNDNGDYANLREDYSGRGMYGATCYGAVVEDIDEFVHLAKKHGIKQKPCTDNMGMKYIVYYPAIKGK
jgi:hypothetical protein